MQTVFSHIIQKRYSQSYEDIATDALAYVLNTHDSVRLGLMNLLRSIISDLPNLYFRTQIVEGSIRPDMWGYGGAETYVYFENKFWAGLTENQPVSYLKELEKYPHPTILLFVVPGAREQSIIAELTRRLNDADIKFIEKTNVQKNIIWCIKTGTGPFLSLTSWPRLIDLLEFSSKNNSAAKNDLELLRSLCDAADIGKFIPMNSTDLINQITPALILQLGQLIRDSIETGLREGFLNNDGLTESVNWTKFGKYVWLDRKDRVGIWFGLDHELWKEYGVSPLWVKFSTTNFGRSYEVEPILRINLENQQTIITLHDGSLILPVNLKTGADKDQVILGIVEQLRDLTRLLASLPIISDM